METKIDMEKDSKNKGSLTVVGTGIQLGGHITQEALDSITSAEIVFAVVADAATMQWLKMLNSNTQSLSSYYDKDKYRLDSYQQMANEIINAVTSGLKTCAIFYGHPGVFVYPSHYAIDQLKKAGFEASMLPAISADACLFADLGVDPAKNGCQSYEATDFLLFNRSIDSTVACIIWQIGVIGEMNAQNNQIGDGRLNLLIDELLKYYPVDHKVCVYEAAKYNIFKPVIRWVALEQLKDSSVSPISTLFLPAANTKTLNLEMAKKLKVDIKLFT